MMRRLIDAAFERNYHWLVVKVYSAVWAVWFLRLLGQGAISTVRALIG